MNNKYRKTITTVSLINYHFVFCPRYRRKIFDIQKLIKGKYNLGSTSIQELKEKVPMWIGRFCNVL